jgi:hypothetical protein
MPRLVSGAWAFIYMFLYIDVLLRGIFIYLLLRGGARACPASL